MKKLIEALNIFLKYNDLDYPTHCTNDIMMIMGINQYDINIDDIEKLKELGFNWDYEYECYASFRYGSA